jgi:glutamate/tyrosine decarboxylase-like PLP-dependent enzyme
MNAANLALAASLVPPAYLAQGAEEARRREALVRALLTQRRLPDEGWPDAAIEDFVRALAAMDSNNFTGAVGAGEREARVWSRLVRARHWGLAHGVGRSGDVAAPQPKAAGSSLLAALTHALALSAARECGLRRTAAALVLPLATGMTLALVLSTLRARRGAGARLVVWSRIDQKSAFKCIAAAGLTAVVVPLRADGDELRTDVPALRAAVLAAGAGAVVAVLTTTSCFAPRAPDDVRAVGRLCAELDVPHVVNHAYGLQSARLCGVLNEACGDWPLRAPRRAPAAAGAGAGAAAAAGGRAGDGAGESAGESAGEFVGEFVGDNVGESAGESAGDGVGESAGERAGESAGERAGGGAAAGGAARGSGGGAARGGGGGGAPASRVDAWVSSTDKNFLVPVGGAIVGSPDARFVADVARAYAGRASAAPLIDLFVTLLGLGARGLRELLAERAAAFDALRAALARVAAPRGERVLATPHNPISLAVTLARVTAAAPADATVVGSLLFSRGVSGTRVVAPGAPDTRVEGVAFRNYGASVDEYAPGPYFTAAAALGIALADVPVIEERVGKALAAFAARKPPAE